MWDLSASRKCWVLMLMKNIPPKTNQTKLTRELLQTEPVPSSSQGPLSGPFAGDSDLVPTCREVTAGAGSRALRRAAHEPLQSPGHGLQPPVSGLTQTGSALRPVSPTAPTRPSAPPAPQGERNLSKVTGSTWQNWGFDPVCLAVTRT